MDGWTDASSCRNLTHNRHNKGPIKPLMPAWSREPPGPWGAGYQEGHLSANHWLAYPGRLSAVRAHVLSSLRETQ